MSRPRRDPYGLSPAWTAVGDRSVRSLSAGETSDQPEVVLLPGLGSAGYLVPWTRLTSRWTRATLLDLPGWRDGRALGCPATLPGVSAALAGWLEATDRRDVVLLGHSTGAQAVLHAALLVPDRVAGVVLAGPTFDPRVRALPRLVVSALSTARHENLGAAVASLPSYLRSGVIPLLRFALSALPDRPEDALARLSAPVLVLGAELDGYAPPAWVRRLAGVAAAPVHVLPGGHADALFPDATAADAVTRRTIQQWTDRATEEVPPADHLTPRR